MELFSVKNTITAYCVDNRCTQRYGGYRTYWNLYGQFIKLVRESGVKRNLLSRIWTFIWVCLIKPLGQFYSTFTRFRGEFKIINGRFENVSLKKHRTYKIFGIPLLKLALGITDEDINKLTK